jgi:hypothetical protein
MLSPRTTGDAHVGQQVAEFGAFRLDPAERLLLRDGQPVALTPKAFDLLLYLVERVGRLNEIVHTGSYEEIDYDDLTKEQKAAIDSVDAERILSEALQGDFVDLRAVKFVLRFLSAFRRPDLVDPVLNNLPKLLPVTDSVAKFFDVLDEVEDAAHAEIGGRLLEYITGELFVPDFAAMWLLDPFTKSNKWNNLPELRKIARDAKNRLVRRQAMLGLNQSGSRSALLDAKSMLDDSRDWEERAILFACSELPRDEFDAMVTHVGGHGGQWTPGDVLRKAVLVFCKSA